VGGGSSPDVANVSRSTTSTSTAASTGAENTSRSSSATTSRSNRATPLPKGSAAQLLVEWAGCMRRHGDPDQADPTIGVNNVIDIPWNPATPGGYYGTNKGGQGNSGPGQYCRQYLAAAQTALRGGRPLKAPNAAALVGFSECMRANGVPDFPDPGANGSLILPGGPGRQNNPTFKNAARVCTRKTGVSLPGGKNLPPGTITLTGA
jgi:hypothetical protein